MRIVESSVAGRQYGGGSEHLDAQQVTLLIEVENKLAGAGRLNRHLRDSLSVGNGVGHVQVGCVRFMVTFDAQGKPFPRCCDRYRQPTETTLPALFTITQMLRW